MIEQFQKILHTPKQPSSRVLNRTQDLILTTFEQILPGSLDISGLSKILEDGENNHKMKIQSENSNQEQDSQQTSYNKNIQFVQDGTNCRVCHERSLIDQITVNLKLVEYFVKIVKENFVSIDHYRSLQEQTQKIEATVRSHIKLEQEMHMYISQLQKKLQKYDKLIYNANQNNKHTHLKQLRNIQQMQKNVVSVQSIQQKYENIRQVPIKSNSSQYIKLTKQIQSLKAQNMDLKLQVQTLGSQLSTLNAMFKCRDQKLCRTLINNPVNKRVLKQHKVTNYNYSLYSDSDAVRVQGVHFNNNTNNNNTNNNTNNIDWKIMQMQSNALNRSETTGLSRSQYAKQTVSIPYAGLIDKSHSEMQSFQIIYH